MTVEEWCTANPQVSKEVIVQELCEWRAKASKYKELFHNETENSARLRSQLKSLLGGDNDCSR